MVAFQDLVSTLSHDRYLRGRQFERICRWYLRNDPVFSHQIGQVWLVAGLAGSLGSRRGHRPRGRDAPRRALGGAGQGLRRQRLGHQGRPRHLPLRVLAAAVRPAAAACHHRPPEPQRPPHHRGAGEAGAPRDGLRARQGGPRLAAASRRPAGRAASPASRLEHTKRRPSSMCSPGSRRPTVAS